MLAYCVAHHTHIIRAYMSKSFSTLTINGNNCFYCNIIIYNLNPLDIANPNLKKNKDLKLKF